MKYKVIINRGGTDHIFNITGKMVGTLCVAQDTATIVYGRSVPTYGIYKDGIQLKGGFDKMFIAIEYSKLLDLGGKDFNSTINK